MPFTADELLRCPGRLLTERVFWESHRREVAQLVLPRSDFFQERLLPGDKHTEKIFDATACPALERFTASIESRLIPRTQRWHGLRSQRAELKEDPTVRVWLDRVCDLLFAMHYAPRTNFSSQTNDAFMSMGAFGTRVMFIESEGDELRYRSVHISEAFIAENAHGLINTVFRKTMLAARQAVERFGEDNALVRPSTIGRSRAAKTGRKTKILSLFSFLTSFHCVPWLLNATPQPPSLGSSLSDYPQQHSRAS